MAAQAGKSGGAAGRMITGDRLQVLEGSDYGGLPLTPASPLPLEVIGVFPGALPLATICRTVGPSETCSSVVREKRGVTYEQAGAGVAIEIALKRALSDAIAEVSGIGLEGEDGLLTVERFGDRVWGEGEAESGETGAGGAEEETLFGLRVGSDAGDGFVVSVVGEGHFDADEGEVFGFEGALFEEPGDDGGVEEVVEFEVDEAADEGIGVGGEGADSGGPAGAAEAAEGDDDGAPDFGFGVRLELEEGVEIGAGADVGEVVQGDFAVAGIWVVEEETADGAEGLSVLGGGKDFPDIPGATESPVADKGIAA